MDDNILINHAFFSIGKMYCYLGEYDKALDYSIRSSSYFKRLDEAERLDFLNDLIGKVYFCQCIYNKAIKYLIKANKQG